MTDPSEPRCANADQIAYWNDLAGQKWVRYQTMLDRQLDELGAIAMGVARLASGEAVLDVGCGCGSSTLELGRRVGPPGRAVGLDISRPMLQLARQRSRTERVPNATFLEADAQMHAFRPEFDVLFSRFGVMFFEDPVAAFTNLHGAIRRGARVAFVCWQALQHNEWMLRPMMAAFEHITLDSPPSPDAPGPFAFARPERVEGILGAAGYRNVVLRALEVDLTIGGGLPMTETVSFLLEMGPLGRVLTGAPYDLKAKVSESVKDAIAPHASHDGVKMKGAVWVVTADA
jgi:SAM-dependent methyltransferase